MVKITFVEEYSLQLLVNDSASNPGSRALNTHPAWADIEMSHTIVILFYSTVIPFQCTVVSIIVSIMEGR